jgi:hypothetical protein
MSYLFGDSTPSPLDINFIDFLRDGLEFCVEVAASTDELQRETERGEGLRQAARSEIDRLEKLGLGVELAVQSFSPLDGDGPLVRCAVAVIQSTNDLVKNEMRAVNAALQSEEAKVEAARASKRDKCLKALEKLLLRHDLPLSGARLRLKAIPNAPYAVELHTTTPLGVAATMALDVPASHLFSHVIRVDRIVEHVKVHVPDVGGWLHKEPKTRTHRLEKLHVIELDLGERESSLSLRAAPDGSGSGFDVLLSAESSSVKLRRIEERDGSSEPQFEADEADASDLRALVLKLEAPARELAPLRKTLMKASLDDLPLRDHNAPTLLVERLIQAMAPVVHEIATRSPSTTELVLKRLVGGGRREEIFVGKSELREKLERVPAVFRSLFEPLDLADERPGAVSASIRPPPLPARVSASRSNEALSLARRALSPAEMRPGESARPTDLASPADFAGGDSIDAGFQIISVPGEKPLAG